MANNSMWVIEELKGWLQQGISGLQGDAINAYTDSERIRLTEKINTMKMVLVKIEELQNQ